MFDFRNKKNEEIYYKIIADIILSYDINTKGNPHGFRTVTQMIANKICEGLLLFDYVAAFPTTCQIVQRNMEKAIEHLENDLGHVVYRKIQDKVISEDGKTTGGKFVEYITTDANYEDAPIAEKNRLAKRLSKNLNAVTKKLTRIKENPEIFILNTVKRVAYENNKKEETKVLTKEEEQVLLDEQEVYLLKEHQLLKRRKKSEEEEKIE